MSALRALFGQPAWGVVFAAATACFHAIPTPPEQTPPILAPAQAELQVGVGRADITLPPGAATFGHALDARVAEGYWTRTYCRAFYFESGSGSARQRLAFVPCELPAMSALLQRTVAERFNAKLENDPDAERFALHPSQLLLTATHTHAGVGHFFGASQYTSHFSSRLPGYDDALRVELAERIATAIHIAFKAKRPAQISWHHRDDFWCYTRNRSLEAYHRNDAPYDPAAAQIGTPAYEEAIKRCPEQRADFRAIDPNMLVLSIDALDEQHERVVGPLGSISFFAMHPTVLPSSNKLFGGDTAGVVSRVVERRLRRRCGGAACLSTPDPLHAVVNTNEGDISPIWSRGDTPEAIAIGQAVGEFVWETHSEPSTPLKRPRFGVAYIEDDITKAEFSDRGVKFSACDTGLLGQGAARGASDHLTSVEPLTMFSTNPPVDYSACDCQSPKRPLLGVIGRAANPKGAFPEKLPQAVVQLGEVMIAFVPAELTINAGHRLRQRVVELTRGRIGAPQQVVIAGLANEYIQYVATREEYQLQQYEGASTLYGENSAAYFRHRASLLARWLVDPNGAKPVLDEYGLTLGEVANDPNFKFGPYAERLAQPTGDEHPRRHLSTCSMIVSPVTAQPPILCMMWHDDGVGDVELRSSPGERWVHLVDAGGGPARLCLADENGVCDPAGEVDDTGVEFRTRVHDRVGDAWVWSTTFAPSSATWSELGGRKTRIRIGSREPSVQSAEFSPQSLPPTCSPEQARVCSEGQQTDDWEALVRD
jgi:neutral ceramidase